jgi:hypothetical protein
LAGIIAGRFAPHAETDRNFFLLFLASIWGGIAAGFIPDMFEHVLGKHVPYSPIVHVHALVYVGWLALLTAQMGLVRGGRADLHRRLGMAALVMIPAMVVLGPLTYVVMGRLEFGTPDGDPPFLILPVVLGAMAFGLFDDVIVAWVYNQPAWAVIATHILGH